MTIIIAVITTEDGELIQVQIQTIGFCLLAICLINSLFIPSINYERHGIVSNRPAEVKIEVRFDIRYKINNTWFGIYYEKQNEMFLGFLIIFMKISSEINRFFNRDFVNSRLTNTLHFSINKIIEF